MSRNYISVQKSYFQTSLSRTTASDQNCSTATSFPSNNQATYRSITLEADSLSGRNPYTQYVIGWVRILS